MKSFVLILALIVSACAPVTGIDQPSTSPAARVRFTLEPVSPGVVRLMLDNGASEPVGYNLCTSRLQRNDGGTWVAVPTDEVCTMQISTLNPGHDATFEKRLPAGIPTGEYRYVTRVEIPFGTPAQELATNTFTYK